MGDAPFLPEWFARFGYRTARFGKVAHDAYESDVRWQVAKSMPFFSAQAQAAFAARWAAGDERASRADWVFERIFRDQAARRKQGISPVPTEPGVAPPWELRQYLWYAATIQPLPLPDDGAGEPDVAAAQAAAAYLEERGRDRQPFLLALGLHRPHLPWVAPKRCYDAHPAATRPIPAEPPGLFWALPAFAHTPLGKLATNPAGEAGRRSAIQAYHAAIAFADEQVGKLLDALDRAGLADDTLVVLHSDHGYHLGDHAGQWHKLTLFEQGLRVPLVVAGPGVRRGGQARGIVELVDLFPTLAEAAGLPLPSGLDGVSFAPLLADPSRPGKPAAYAELVRQGMGDVRGLTVRTERHRYTVWGDNLAVELYDHDADPREHRNAAFDSAQAAARRDLDRLLARHRTTVPSTAGPAVLAAARRPR